MSAGRHWHVGETYLKVLGRWAYLYRAMDRDGRLVDTMLSVRRDVAAAPAFLRSAKATTGVIPDRVTTDAHGSYPRAVRTTLDLATARVEPVLARRNSERFKGPNDLVFARNGDLYFTDQGQTGLHDPTGRVYRLRPDGRLDCLLNNGPSPNGLALSPDEEVLFVAMTRDNAVWRLPLLPDGSTAKVGRFASFHGTSGPDGLAVDAAGNLLVAHASLGSVFVLSPQGEPVARIRSCRGATTTNLALGGPGGGTVFVTESETGAVLAAEWAQDEQEPHTA